MLAALEAAWSRQGMQLRLAEAHADVPDILRAEGLRAHAISDKGLQLTPPASALLPLSGAAEAQRSASVLP